jgi:hypothetical protein
LQTGYVKIILHLIPLCPFWLYEWPHSFQILPEVLEK